MKKPWLVVYSSLSGNTKSVGEAIYQVLPEGSEIYAVENAPSAEGYEKVAIGYWVDKGTADAKATEYLKNTQNAEVFVYATLGAYPDSEHAMQSLERGVDLLGEGCTILGKFICQGRLSKEIMERMKQFPEGHPHAPSPERLKRWEDASIHPNEEDFKQVQELVKKIL